MSPRCRCVASCIFLVLQANCSWRGYVCLPEVYHCCTVDRTSQMLSSILPDLQQLVAVVAMLFVQSCTPVPASGGDRAPSLWDGKIYRGPRFLNAVFFEKNVHFHGQNF